MNEHRSQLPPPKYILSNMLDIPGSPQITPIPLHPTVVRLEAVKAAQASGVHINSLVQRAGEIEAFINGGGGDYFDHDTMDKVYKAIEDGLEDCHFISKKDDAVALITALQNAGILFRESR